MTTISTVRERFNVSRWALKYPWLTVSVWLVVSVAGIFSFTQLKYNLFPDVAFPVVVVTASFPSLDAEETERSLTIPIEKQLNTLENVEKMRSSSYPGQIAVSLSFGVGTDLEADGKLVEAQIKQLKLPAGTETKVSLINLNESAAITYAIVGKSPKSLAPVARKRIVSTLEKLPGVLKVNLLGDPEVNKTMVIFDNHQALAVQVVKRAQANTLEVVSEVQAEVQRLQKELPDLKLVLATNQATYIHEATQATVDALALAVFLSVLVIYPFLRNWRATIISALAIPISLFGTFIVMAWAGFKLETITLLALALVIGIIVDDAIVDVENIARHLEDGEPPEQAAIHATNEIGLTVTAATFTIVAVFLPVGLMGGTLGQFFRPFGLTISAAVITSLLVARTLSPLLAARWLQSTPKHTDTKFLAEPYRRVLIWSLDHRWLTLGLAFLGFIGGLALIPLIPKGFIPHLDRGEFNVNYTAPLPTSLEDSAEIARQLNQAVRRNPNVETVFTTAGSRQGEPFKGTLYVKLKDQRSGKTIEIQSQLRAELPTIPDVAVSVEDLPFVDTGSEKPVQAALIGDNLTDLDSAVQKLKQRLEKRSGFADVSTNGISRLGEQVIEISHLDGHRVAYVSANLTQGFPLDKATAQMIAEAKAAMPASVTLNLGGDSQRSSEIFGSFGATLGLSVLCILAVLLLLFRNLADPLVILLSLPLSIAGALVAQFLTRTDFGMISVIGFIFLLGLANKNGILLVDYINQLRRAGMPLTAAILTAGPIRLRPILMTTAATILGMIPLALGIGAGAELRSPMAVAIIGGLVASTLLSLLVIPAAYSLVADLRDRKMRSS
ncbi:MAG: efflux RND transporter permease subunit [Anaerolineae bacterium]|nr:efflux RND transporter permease subunit [Gloeobacterales cyanobacterium ES-bin-313]